MAKIFFQWLIRSPLLLFIILLGQINGEGNSWSQPDSIPGYHPEAGPPILVADQNRTVHAFSSQWVGENSDTPTRVVMYNQWTYEQGWTLPVDIILSPIKEARILDAFLDSKGIIHIIFWGGDNTAAWIYYTKAPAVQAGDPRTWQPPILAASQAGDPASGRIIVRDNGSIDIIYHGRIFGNGVYRIYSENNGDSWSDPNIIFSSLDDAPFISRINFINDKSDGLHLVWNTFSVDGQGREIFYAKYKGNFEESSSPILIAKTPSGLGVMNPIIIDYKNVLFIFFNHPPKIVMRRSFDDGSTWESTEVLFRRHIGVNGTVSPVIDSELGFHLFFGQRIPGNPDIHGMWHSEFVNDQWTEPNAIVKGPLIVDKQGFSGFDPYEARAVISQGNKILVTWQTDFASLGNGVRYSYKQFNIRENELIPLPNLSDENILTVEDTEQDNSLTNQFGFINSNMDLVGSDINLETEINPNLLILISLTPVLILLFIIFCLRYYKTQKK
jgi:hypothetical protein